MTVTMRVLPRWRICYQGKAYSAGDIVELDLLTAAEWSAWGSIERARALTDAERAELMQRWGLT